MRYLTILFIFFGLKLNAQEIILLDALTELPIEGVSVSSKTKDLGVISNNMGITNLSVFSSKETLIIQHIAYQKIEQIKSSIQQKTIFLVLKTHLRKAFGRDSVFLVRKNGKALARSGKQTEQGRSPRLSA